MSTESVIAVQVIAFAFALASIIVMLNAVKTRDVDWRVLALPLMLMGNLSLFLLERIVAKLFFGGTDISDPFFSGSFVNSWAMVLQVQLAFTAFFAIGLTIINRRVNGHR